MISFWKKMRFEERLIYLNCIAVFIPCFVSGLTTLIFGTYVLLKSDYRRLIRLSPRMLILAAWAILALVAGLIRGDFLGAAALLTALCFALFGLFVYRFITPSFAWRLLDLFAALNTAAFIIAAVQLIWPPHHRSPSVFFNANYYGFVCELAVLISVFALAQGERNRRLHLISLGAGIGGMIVSECRSAWLALFLGVLALLWCLKKHRAIIAVSLSGTVMGGAIACFPGLIPRMDSMDATKSLREVIWRVAYRGFLDRPIIGNGFLSYLSLSKGMDRAYQPHAHDIFLDMLVNYGVLGTLLLMIFVVLSVVGCIRGLRTNRFGAFVPAVLVVIVVHGVTDLPMIGLQTGVFTAAILAFCGAGIHERPNGTGQQLIAHDTETR